MKNSTSAILHSFYIFLEFLIGKRKTLFFFNMPAKMQDGRYNAVSQVFLSSFNLDAKHAVYLAQIST